MSIVERINSNVDTTFMCVILYNKGRVVESYDKNELSYFIVQDSDSNYTAYVTNGKTPRKISKATTWNDCLNYVKVFEACLLHAGVNRSRNFGIECDYLRYMKQQYCRIPLKFQSR